MASSSGPNITFIGERQIVRDDLPFSAIPPKERMAHVVKSVYIWICQNQEETNPNNRGTMDLLHEATGISKSMLYNIVRSVPARYSEDPPKQPDPPSKRKTIYCDEHQVTVREIVDKMNQNSKKPSTVEVYREFRIKYPDFQATQKSFMHLLKLAGGEYHKDPKDEKKSGWLMKPR